ncbi:MAG: hypothetical protein PHE88_09865 [Elusimicrobia bacterium]|nr:hypothetical protein [Elusimicrobiota bacterium]
MKINKTTLLYVSFLTSSIVFNFTASASASDGIPMITIIMPSMILSLIPIIFIESWAFRHFINILFWRSLKIMSLANLVSALLSIPIVFIILLGLAILIAVPLEMLHINLNSSNFLSKIFFFTFGTATLEPEQFSSCGIVPITVLVSLIQCFFASWFLKYTVAKQMMKDFEKSLIRNATLRTNLISYSFLVVLVLIISFYSNK